ncbi:MAG: single-stranded-DNA-specific exonuclease RecJ [Candidatus Saccharibacteria bacterium]|nr:single-stranded-DNA-specific exonuclease RecJ [Candidatus Saccharibacteria bacterium]
MAASVDAAELSPLVNQILVGRGYQTRASQQAFLNPDYMATNYDPFLLTGMKQLVERLQTARVKGERITIYCDYDVDGTTACAVLLDALPRFGLTVDYYVPDRFSEGYGLNKTALKQLKERGTDIVLTVDNGIVSFDEATYAVELGLDLLITDHHSPRDDNPTAMAVVDPKIALRDKPDAFNEHFCLTNKRLKKIYPFLDLCGCGVAFKLVQALQQIWPDDLPVGQEKWLLDLVAIATVSDIVSLVDENRAIVRWGIEVIKKTRRPGLRALVAVAGVELGNIDSRAIGFMLGPRLNAAGRLVNAKLAIELLSATDNQRALELATELNDLNNQRKSLQNQIYELAISQVKTDEPVAIAMGDGWHEGVVGIVASKVQEKTEKPTFIFSRSADGKMLKASGRSFGDFSIAAAINATSTLLERGGGHAAAGGITVTAANFDAWRQAVNDYYRSLKLTNQLQYLYPKPDVEVSNLGELTPQIVQDMALLEPFGEANPVPTFLLKNVIVSERRLMGNDLQHVRYTFTDDNGNRLQAVAFNAADRFTLEPSETADQRADVLVELSLNDWNGSVSVQGKLIRFLA